MPKITEISPRVGLRLQKGIWEEHRTWDIVLVQVDYIERQTTDLLTFGRRKFQSECLHLPGVGERVTMLKPPIRQRMRVGSTCVRQPGAVPCCTLKGVCMSLLCGAYTSMVGSNIDPWHPLYRGIRMPRYHPRAFVIEPPSSTCQVVHTGSLSSLETASGLLVGAADFPSFI